MHHIHTDEGFASGIHEGPHVFHRERFPGARGAAAVKNEATLTSILLSSPIICGGRGLSSGGGGVLWGFKACADTKTHWKTALGGGSDGPRAVVTVLHHL
jgi:hypothetical protein